MEFPINFTNKNGNLIEKTMKKEVQPGKIALNHSFSSSEETDRFYTALQSGRGQPSGQAFCKVQYADLTLAKIAADAARWFGVKHYILYAMERDVRCSLLKEVCLLLQHTRPTPNGHATPQEVLFMWIEVPLHLS